MASIKDTLALFEMDMTGAEDVKSYPDIASALDDVLFLIVSRLAEQRGRIAQNQAAATAAGADDDKVKLSDFNALLRKLKDASLMEEDPNG